MYVGKGAFWKCTNLEKVEIQNDKQSPEFDCSAFAETKEGITFYVPNKEVAKQLSEKLLCTSIVNAKIYVGNECVYTGITGTEEAWLAKYYEDVPYEMKK